MPNLQKFKFPLLLILALAGLGFTVFAFFFNRATLHLTAAAPYSVFITNTGSISCPQNDCFITLAPAKYQITLIKDGYRNIQESVDLQLGQTYQKSYQLELIPKIQAVGDWNALKNAASRSFLSSSLSRLNLNLPASFWVNLDNSLANFSNLQNFQISSNGENYLLNNSKQIFLVKLPENTSETTPIPSTQPYFYSTNNEAVLYLADNPETLQPTLYLLNLTVRPLVPKILTTFIRKINSYQLIPNKNFTKIALLDQSDPSQVGLYLIDLKAKTKKLLSSSANLLAFKWLENDFLNNSSAVIPTTQKIRVLPTTNSSVSTEISEDVNSFLLQKRNPITFQTELYRGFLDQSNLELLDFSVDLSCISIIDKNQILYGQPYAGKENLPGFTLEKFNLTTSQSQTLFTAPDLALPIKIQYEQSEQRLLFLSGNTVYSLSLTL